MGDGLYSKPITFAIVATVVILVGTIATMFYPMLTPEMHPKLANLKPYTALQLAGRDIYQREGCFYCHTQTVRPLKTEVERYGEYSKAGEFAYDRPFLWGSKRTGPDLARIGGKYPDAWHYKHFENPRAFFPQSDMPSYAFLKDAKLDPESVKTHMDVLGFPYTPQEISALKGKTEMDALVAYVQVIGTAVKKTGPTLAMAEPSKIETVDPFRNDPKAIAAGKKIFGENCAPCHGAKGQGVIGPNLTDDVFLYVKGDVADNVYFKTISNGTTRGGMEAGRTMKGGMPPFKQLGKDKIWKVIAYIRSLQKR